MALTLLATNNAESTLASAISATDTSLIVSAGTGAEFPDAVAGESYFKLTLTDAATGSQVEIVNVTAKAGDIFTIERAQEGTLARAWAANDMVANMMTADTLNIIAQYAQQAAASAAQAEEYANNASDYAQNKFTFYKTASDPDGTIAGLAATTDGQSFWVAQGPDALSAVWQYQNKAGVAVLQAKRPGTAAITGTIREFPTLAAAQADADAGNIMVGSTTYVRSPDGGTLADEYINNGGTLVATGRSMPSQEYVEDIASDSLRVSQPISFISSLLKCENLVSTSGDSEIPINRESLVIVDFASVILGGDKGEVYATKSGVDLFRVTIYPDEIFSEQKLLSPYDDLQLSVASSNISSVDIGNSVSRVALQANLTPDASFTGALTVFDNKGVFTSVTQGGQTGATVPTCAGHTSGRIFIGLPNSAITAAGYELTEAGVKSYLLATYPQVDFHYRSTEYKERTVPLYSMVDSDIVVHIDESVTAKVGVKVKQSTNKSTQLSVYNADIYNPSAYDFTDQPMCIKVKFNPGEVSEHSALVLKDLDGNIYPCQFSGVLDANLRKNSDLMRYTDGSFNTGEIYFYGTLAAGAKKQYRLEVYGNKHDEAESYPAFLFDSTSGNHHITVGDFKWNFRADTGGLYSVIYGGNELKLQTLKRISGITAGAAVENTNYSSFSIQLVNAGPVFAEVEQIAYHTGQGSVPAGAVRSITRYRLFSTGVMQVFNMFQATQQIPANSLYGVRLDLGFSFGTSMDASVYSSASIVRNVAATETNWSLINEFSIGDQRRDDASKLNTWGAIRPNLGTIVKSGEELRMRSGWSFASLTDNSLVNYVVPENWTWSAGHWIFPYSLGTTERELSNRVFNRPVGMAYRGVPAYVLKRRVYDLMERLADGIFDLYSNPENGQISASDKSGYRYPQVYGLLQCLRDGGDFDAQYAVFKTFINDIIGSYSNAGTAYLSGSIVLQFVGRMMFAPVEMYYRYAEKTGNTAVMNDLKIFIASICDGLSTRVEASNGTPLDGSQNYRGNGNSNAEGMRMLALGIYAGLDTAGRYQAAFNTVTAMIKSNTYASFAHPVVMDTFSTYPFMNRWLSYECHFYYVYLRACKLLNITPEFDNSNYLVAATLGNGSPDYLNFILAEDRRGFCETAGAMAVGLMSLDRVSTTNAAYLLLERFEQDWSVDPIAQPHLADFRQLTTPLTVAYEGFEHVCNQFALTLLDKQYLS